MITYNIITTGPTINTTGPPFQTTELVPPSHQAPDFTIGIINETASSQYDCDTVHQLEHYVNLSLEEKRKLYHCGDNFVTLSQIPTWDKEMEIPVPTG